MSQILLKLPASIRRQCKVRPCHITFVHPRVDAHDRHSLDFILSEEKILEFQSTVLEAMIRDFFTKCGPKCIDKVKVKSVEYCKNIITKKIGKFY